MKILTSAQMKEIDRQTIEEVGIPGPVLMENAGLQIFRFLQTILPYCDGDKVVIVTGRGNNGGDGLVIARHLFNHGTVPQVLLLAGRDEVRGDAALNLRIAENIGVPVTEVRSEADWKAKKSLIKEASIIVDAIFGTGLSKPAQGLYAKVIEDINKADAFKLAVDIPSGLSSDSFEIIGPAVKADVTVTLAAPKIAHVLPPAEEWVGELVVADISVPPQLFDAPRLDLELIEKQDLLRSFRKRQRDSHKGSYGHLFIIAGSLGKTGAAVMAAKAALKTGAGLVTVGTPQSCLPMVAKGMEELMTEPLAETDERTISEKALPRLQALIKGKDALLIGPGLSTNDSTAGFVAKALPEVRIPVVIDADGLNILALKPELLKRLPKTAILTPHPGEFARLVGLPLREVIKKKLELAPAFAQEYGVHLILKGYRTLVCAPDGRKFINPTGNPGMATGGSGDVLSGMIASFLMQDKDPLQAALAAVYLHGLSGDLAAEKLGERPLVAGDLIRFLPAALKTMEDEAREQDFPLAKI
jgi:ADP-dependent NAD(P)H-hydrate dehydratase / NAD(P)H-hydrate epimerase